MKNFVAFLLILSTSGCAHYLYQGDFKAENNLNETSQFRLWWTKTEPLLGDVKAGPTILDVECGVVVEFTENNNGIEFIAAADKYEPITPSSNNQLVCGKVTNLDEFLDYEDGDILLNASCKPIIDDEGFSAINPIYLSTNHASYRIPISVKKEWSFLDNALSAPKLECP